MCGGNRIRWNRLELWLKSVLPMIVSIGLGKCGKIAAERIPQVIAVLKIIDLEIYPMKMQIGTGYLSLRQNLN